MEETKTSIELYTKIQTAIDEINARFFEGKKYICPECQAKVWGKAGLSIHCNKCDCDLEEEEE